MTRSMAKPVGAKDAKRRRGAQPLPVGKLQGKSVQQTTRPHNGDQAQTDSHERAGAPYSVGLMMAPDHAGPSVAGLPDLAPLQSRPLSFAAGHAASADQSHTVPMSATTGSATVYDIHTGTAVAPMQLAAMALSNALAPDNSQRLTAQLLRAIDQATPRPLPRQDALEAHFEAGLSSFHAVLSHEISSLLRVLGAEAAVWGDRMALVRSDVSFDTLKHETAHLLQTARAATATPEETRQDVQERDLSAQERDADQAMDTGEVTTTLPQGVVAFRAAHMGSGEDGQADAFRRALQSGDSARTHPSDRTAAPVTETLPAAESSTDTDRTGDTHTEVSQTGDLDAVPSLAQPAPTIETDLPPLPPEAEQAAAALEAAQSALVAAVTPEGYWDAFTNAPPSLKAAKQPTLAADMAALAEAEGREHATLQPDLTAHVSGDAPAQSVAPVTSPPVKDPDLETQPPAAAPAPVIAPTAAVEPFVANRSLTQWRAPGAGAVDADDLARTLSGVATTDPDVSTSPGAAPVVPLQGENDPARAHHQQANAEEEADNAYHAAAQTVVDGPGPERMEMRQLVETATVDLAEREGALPAFAPAQGSQDFLNADLDAQATALFDAHNSGAMQASLVETQAEMSAMVTERDAQRTAERTAAEARVAAAQTTARDAQDVEVTQARQTIQQERQATLDAQAAAVGDMRDKADREQSRTQDDIDRRVTQDEAQIAADFQHAEEDAQAKLTAAEAKAEAEKQKAQKAAEGDSWWDRATSWVSEQLSKLGDLIGDIFAAVRAGITVILDAAKKVAFALIDAAATFIKDAISLYGSFLKTLVTGLVGSVFPELAERLNAAIDEGVRLAQAVVDNIAADLKTAVNAAVELYKKGLSAILDFVEGALNTVLAVAQAALAGDWAEVARLVIEPILAALGINKDDFYAYVGTAAEGLLKIISNPLAFLGNLLDAVVGGFRLFGDHFVDHLIAGVISWLTGALGGSLQMPKQWDIWGVLDLARQILGLTLDRIRQIAVKILGEGAVAKIEFFMGYARTLLTEGWAKLFVQIKDDLGDVFGMVMGEITSFLMDRVVKAGLVWLASLINPAGLLVKLVLMIWDFIMWMKDNFMRLVQILKTIVDGMVQIANGNLDPAKKAIERVLGNMLGPAIDLLMRLLGLGNVAGRVRKIIEKLRQRIEKAIVKLIRKVMARFVGKGGQRSGGGRAGALMKPLRFSGGGETHTLYVEKRGRDVVPMMRSTPTAVEDWLLALKTDAGVKRQLVKKTPQITDEAVVAKKGEIAPLVAKALKEEQDMDQAGDRAGRASDQAASRGTGRGGGRAGTRTTAQATGQPAAQATDEAAQLARQAQEAAAALSQILEKLGLSDAPDFEQHFATDIAKVRKDFQGSLKGEIARRINADKARKVIYSDLSWAGVRQHLGTDDAVLVGHWKQPFHSGGALIKQTDFMAKTYELAQKYITDHADELQVSDATKELDTQEKKDKFARGALRTALAPATVRARLIAKMIGPRQGGFAGYVTAVKPEIEAAAADFARARDDGPDKELKDAIQGKKPFADNGFFGAGTYATKLIDFPASKKPAEKRIHIWKFFDGAYSAKASKNRTYMAEQVRVADTGQHEWIPSSMAGEAMRATVEMLNGRGARFGEAAEGFANLVEFQHKVRIPTGNVIFAPVYIDGLNDKVQMAPYLSKKHVADYKDKSGETPTPDEWKRYYDKPEHFGKEVRVLQGHAGGIYYRKADIDKDARTIANVDYQVSQRSSAPWHGSPSSGGGIFGLAQDLFDGPVTMPKLRVFAGKTLGFYNYSLITSAADAAVVKNKPVTFDQYKFSSKSGIAEGLKFDAMVEQIASQAVKERTKMVKAMRAAFGDFSEIAYTG